MGDYFVELRLIFDNQNISISEKYLKMRELLERVCVACTQDERIQFSNLFSRLCFVCQKFNASRSIHIFRMASNAVLFEGRNPSNHEFVTHFMYLCRFISEVTGFLVPLDLEVLFPEEAFVFRQKQNLGTKLDKLRVEIVAFEDGFLICEAEDVVLDLPIKVCTPKNQGNEIFASVSEFWIGAQLYLVNIEVLEEVYYPKFLILEPDYLLDVSAISECFQDYGSSELKFLMNKFEEPSNSRHIRLGNFANFVVDELFGVEDFGEVTFNDVFYKDFISNPIEYTSCEDLISRDGFERYFSDAKRQFETIKRVIGEVFPEIELSIIDATLEPSLLCDLYGIQGRLDILELVPDGISKIVELKSGSGPFPEDGLSMKPNHETQLFLYYQLIAILKGLPFNKIVEKINGYIFYSKVETRNLRYKSPSLERMQQIYEMRNRILVNEFKLASDDISVCENIIERISAETILKPFGLNDKFRKILENQFLAFSKPIENATELEKKYFFSFVSFIAKEHYLSKVGFGDNYGLANLWLKSFAEKEERFEILYDLEIRQNLVHTEEKEIIFERTNPNNKFANFRDGDICVLYPRADFHDNATKNQVFKCTIKTITNEVVVLKFKFKQRNISFFEKHEKWALERDSMDNSFTTMYRNLYAFLCANSHKKELLLSQRIPEAGENKGFFKPYLSDEQNRIINNALSAKDYFLLNGPPGTGKTSVIVKELVRELHTNTNSNILLLAYTNRAVDELCDAIHEAINDSDLEPKFIRIGSALSCAEVHRPNLLNSIIEETAQKAIQQGKQLKRDDVKKILEKHRIYVTTVASISNRTDIFKFKKFDTLIVDEASQILEPQIIGLLPKCGKFIMIGDHKQLPAIVLQDANSAKTNNGLLESIGLENRKNSLFERLYLYCQKKQLHYAFDTLTYQGRMHREIARFPNEHFYDSCLREAFEISNLNEESKTALARQVAALEFTNLTDERMPSFLSSHRNVFLNCPNTHEKPLDKSNAKEADAVVAVVQVLKSLYQDNNKPFEEKKTIGIIAPFRSQIALIKQKLEEANIQNLNHEDITIDTVERFQGSQRDIIIVSFSVNTMFQMEGMVNTNDEGTVDRKLNVALTRAKEQLILIGNSAILSKNPIYEKLVLHIQKAGGFLEVGTILNI